MENFQIKDQPILPTYRQMLEEAARQLSARKSLLFRRVVYLLWPVWILIIAGYFLEFQVSALGIQSAFDSPLVLVSIIIWFFLHSYIYLYHRSDH